MGFLYPTNIQLITITGEFTCRVDFRQSPTKFHRVRLTVIGGLAIILFQWIIFSIKVPPQTPVIMDQTGKRIVGEVVGPLNQGQSLTLDCVVTGGKGPPLLSTLPWENIHLEILLKETSMINATTPSFP